MMQRTAEENAACLRRICKRCDQPKIERLVNNEQGWYYIESLKGQGHDRDQTESQIATVDSCFDLVGSLQHGVASCEVFSWSTHIHKPTICGWWWPQMKLRSLAIGQCHMQNAWKGTIGKIQNIASLQRKLRTDTNCPAGKSWPNHVKNVRVSVDISQNQVTSFN